MGDGLQEGKCAMLARIVLSVAAALFAAGTGWGQRIGTEEAKLTTSGVADFDELGSAVVIDADLLVANGCPVQNQLEAQSDYSVTACAWFSGGTGDP